MDWLELLKPIIAMALTYGLGLVMNKPGYKKGKNVVNVVNKALADDQLTAEEIQAIVDAVKAKE